MESRKFEIEYRGKRQRISSRVSGPNEELVIFIHGLGCTKEAFDVIWDLQGLDGFTLLTADLIGFGDSSRPTDFSYSMEGQAEVLAELLSGFQFERLHIVAHSMGGAIGLILAQLESKRLASFMNIEGNLIAEDCGMVSQSVVVASFDEFRERVFDEIVESMRTSENEGTRMWAHWSEKADLWGFYKSSLSLVEWSGSGKLLSRFEGLDVKKVYVYGEKNSGMKVLEELEGIDQICIRGSGHFVMQDNTLEFCTSLERFLRF